MFSSTNCLTISLTLLFCLSISLGPGPTQADILTLIDSSELQPDTQAAPCRLSTFDPPSLDSSQNQQKYVLIPEPSGVDTGKNNFNEFVQSSAQYLAPFGYKVCTVITTPESTLIQSDQRIPEPIRIVLLGPSTSATTSAGVLPTSATTRLYNGRYNVQSLIEFVQQLEQSGTFPTLSLSGSTGSTMLPYRVITNKMERKAFEHLTMAKIVGYFENETVPEFETFVQAARELTANFPVYVVFDPVLAQKMRLTIPGQIALVRRLEKSTIYCPGTGVTASTATEGDTSATPETPTTPGVTSADIVAWASGDRGLIHLLDDSNLYDPEVHDSSKYQLLAVGDRHTPAGMYLYKMVTKTIRNISRENEQLRVAALTAAEAAAAETVTVEPTGPEEPIGQEPTGGIVETSPTQAPPPQPIRLDDIEVVWIDLNKFPNIRSKLPVSNQTNLDVWFGLVQNPLNTDPTSVTFEDIWFDISTLNITGSDKKADESNIQLLRNWILQVTDRPLPVPVPEVVPEPAAETEIPEDLTVVPESQESNPTKKSKPDPVQKVSTNFKTNKKSEL